MQPDKLTHLFRDRRSQPKRIFLRVGESFIDRIFSTDISIPSWMAGKEWPKKGDSLDFSGRPHKLLIREIHFIKHT